MNENGVQVKDPSLTFAHLVRLSMDALSARAMRLLTLAMAFSLFVGAVWYPDWRRLAAAAAFAVIVLPMVWLRKDATHGG